ncbi:MAG: hypothetical protein H7Z41_10110 [Cytophagales bacterium]|nr:hypothetical protein [Armatimonadota bacterium]
MADEGSIAERFEQAVQSKLGGDYDRAETLLKSVLSEQPNNPDAHHELGLVYGFRASDESLPHLLRAVQIVPTSVPYMIDLGKTFAMFGEDDKAKMAFDHVLKLDPFNEEATKNLDYLG